MSSFLELGASNVLLQSEPDFAARLRQRAGELRATAVFDGVGGALASQVAHVAPRGSCLYVYGFLGGDEPLSVPTKVILFNNLTIKGFGVFTSKAVGDPRSLEKTLGDLSTRIAMPHFKTRAGRYYGLEDFESALAYSSPDGARAVLVASP
ncbi:MAG: zinc-binding dehydrogenase [Myxococcales bacterium]|nr:zinc-binding dehydrogenase [Myxococcales bacterium]